MYTKTTLILLIIFTFSFSFSQTKYYSGFDNASQIYGWAQYRKGALSNYEFTYSSNNAFSDLDCLSHDYPVGGSIATDDWFVSREFNFSMGGTLDSLRFHFSGFGNPGITDTVALYVLIGSPDPALASNKVLIHDFRDTNYKRTSQWEKISNIAIPNLQGKSYFAFKYRTVNNWLSIKFDNLALTQNISTHLKVAQKVKLVSIYPNPAVTELNIDFNADILNQCYTIQVFNSFGLHVLEVTTKDQCKLDLSKLSKGMYFIQIMNQNQQLIQSEKISLQ